jgi:hypothetical protein
MELAYKPLQDLRTNSIHLQAYDDVLLPIDRQDVYERHPPTPGTGPVTSGESVDPVQVDARTITSFDGQAPHLVPSAADLRRSLAGDETIPYEHLQAAGHIARAEDYVPVEEA